MRNEVSGYENCLAAMLSRTGGAMPARLHLAIKTTEPVVGFEADGWTRYLTLHGERAFVIGGGCDTCAFVFERKKSNYLSPTTFAERLAAGVGLLDDDLVGAAGSLLPTGDYAVAEFNIEPSLTGPCQPDDYFSHESLDLFGTPSYGGVPDNPRLSYWRARTRLLPPGTGAWPAREGPRPRPTNPKYFFQVVGPLEPPQHLDPERIEAMLQTPEMQWAVSPGDKLFRRMLARHGFKTGDAFAPGGWRCYITDVIKSSYRVKDWQATADAARLAVAEVWADVLRYELVKGQPKLLVVLGKKTEVPLTHLVRRGLIPQLPEATTIYHYSYLGSRPQGRLGPMHPDRVAAWDSEFARIAERAKQLMR
mgnify:CR=1 FL=1